MRAKSRIIRDISELEALKDEWWDLWHRAPAATPFQSPAWLVPWWRAFHPGDLTSVATERDGRLVGLALFYRELGPLGRRLLPLGISLTDYHDVLIDPEFTNEAWSSLIGAMLTEADWDTWEWEDIPPDATALALPLPTAWTSEPTLHNSCPVLSLVGISLSESLSRQQRNAFRLALNRARRIGTVSVETATNDTVRELLNHVIRLHGMRWRSQGQPGVLADPVVSSFHHEAAHELQAAGILRLHALRIGPHLAAAYYGFQHRRRAYYYLSGFDPAFAFESPGVMVVGYAIEQALREGATEFHFLRGQEAYKYAWGATDRWNRRYSVLRTKPASDIVLGRQVDRQQKFSGDPQSRDDQD